MAVNIHLFGAYHMPDESWDRCFDQNLVPPVVKVDTVWRANEVVFILIGIFVISSFLTSPQPVRRGNLLTIDPYFGIVIIPRSFRWSRGSGRT